MHLSLRHSSLRVVARLDLDEAVLVGLHWRPIHLIKVALRIHKVVSLGVLRLS